MNIVIKKQGFTLAEAMIVMVLFSIMLVAATPLISKKHIEFKKVGHGAYSCTYDDAKTDPLKPYIEKTFKNDVETSSALVATCTFDPPANAEYFLIQAVGGGGGGGYAGGMVAGDFLASQASAMTFFNIDTNPPVLPNWLTTDTYNTYAGQAVMYTKGAGGQGGDYYSPGTGTWYGNYGRYSSNIVNDAGAYVYAANCVTNIIAKPLVVNVTTTGCNGKAGNSIDSSNYVGNTNTDGNMGTGAVVSWAFQGQSAKTCGGARVPYGGVRALTNTYPGYRNYTYSSSGTGATLSCATDASPQYEVTNKPGWQINVNKGRYSFGTGGGGGKYSSLFIPSFKASANIIPGQGGVAGTNVSPYTGGTGGTTYLYVGNSTTPLLQADPGAGGTRTQTTYQILTYAPKDGLTYNAAAVGGAVLAQYGGAGGKPQASATELVSGFSSSYKLSSIAIGQGGQGGGSYGRCKNGNGRPLYQIQAFEWNGTTYLYNLKTVSPAQDVCGGVPTEYGAIDTVDPNYATKPGSGGGVIIYW